MHRQFDQILRFSIAMSAGAGFSHHIVNSVIRDFDRADFEFQDAVDFLKSNYSSLTPITPEHWGQAEKFLASHSKNNIHSISYFDEAYPDFLKAIKNPPSALYLKGDKNILKDLPGVAVVGTRKVTEKGAKIANRISAYMASHGWVVVSGLALGVDGCAHEGALSVNGKTIAVLAHGLHKASPKQNSLLADEILLKGGAWVSEHPWGIEPRREYFVHRNRIQIGLSAGSIIVESEIKSGTATQAEFCIDANRVLFAVVPETNENSLRLLSEGPLHLVRDKGAIPIRSKVDYDLVLEKLTAVRNRLTNI